jgi:hypothetical protein
LLLRRTERPPDWPLPEGLAMRAAAVACASPPALPAWQRAADWSAMRN